jgi:methylated-DNA-[protein]-cysteine S-methyltransferase
MRLLLDRQPSPIGTMMLVHDDDGALFALDFEDFEDRMKRLLRLRHGAVELGEAAAPAKIRGALDRYFAKDFKALDVIETRAGGTDFQRAAWDALRAIPPGETRSYGAQAIAIGRPTAGRAVGLANGSNPVAIVVPCHRVIGASGALTGYGGGLWRKRWLLDHETG